MPIRLEQRGHDHVDHDHPEDEEGAQIPEGLLLLLHLPCEVYLYPPGDIHSGKLPLYILHHVPQGAAEDVGFHLDYPLAVSPLYLHGTITLPDGGDIPEPHLSPQEGGDGDLPDALYAVFVPVPQAQEDVVIFAYIPELGGVIAVEVVPQGLGHHGHIDADRRGLFPVQFHPQLGPRGLLAEGHIDRPRDLLHPLLDPLRKARDHSKIMPPDLNRDPPFSAHEHLSYPRGGAHREPAQARDLLDLLPQGRCHLLCRPLPFSLPHQFHSHLAHIGPFLESQGRPYPLLRLAAEGIMVFRLGYMREDLIYLPQDPVRLLNPGPFG